MLYQIRNHLIEFDGIFLYLQPDDHKRLERLWRRFHTDDGLMYQTNFEFAKAECAQQILDKNFIDAFVKKYEEIQKKKMVKEESTMIKDEQVVTAKVKEPTELPIDTLPIKNPSDEPSKRNKPVKRKERKVIDLGSSTSIEANIIKSFNDPFMTDEFRDMIKKSLKDYNG